MGEPAEVPSGPTDADFDRCFTGAAVSAGLRRVWQLAAPDLPARIEPFSFVSLAFLGHLQQALALSPGQRLVDLACGRGGPGLWLAQRSGAVLTGVDFSAVAVAQAAERAALFGLGDGQAEFVVGDLAGTGLPAASADAVVCIDALHFAADLVAGAGEALRVLRPGGRLVLTNWQPRTPGDPRLPSSRRDRDWQRILVAAGFTDVRLEVRPEWHEFYTRIYQTALELGDPGEDTALAALQNEARLRLPTAELLDRVQVTGTRPAGG